MARIRTEMGKTRGLFPATPATRPEYPRAEAEAITAQLAERWPEALERFRREFEKVGGVFHRVPTLTEVPQVVTGIARAREARRLVSWHPSQLGADLGQALAASGLTPLPMPPGEATDPTERARLRQLVASAELGLTGVDLAIAETGPSSSAPARAARARRRSCRRITSRSSTAPRSSSRSRRSACSSSSGTRTVRRRTAAQSSASSPARAARRTSSSRSRAASTGRKRCTSSSSRGRSVADRYFTPREVEALIPVLARVMREVMTAHTEATALREKLQAEQQRIALAGGGVLDRAQWRADTERIKKLTERMQDALEKIVELGGTPKDLGLGLVDFPHLRDGREVNLCWKYGDRSEEHTSELQSRLHLVCRLLLEKKKTEKFNVTATHTGRYTRIPRSH